MTTANDVYATRTRLGWTQTRLAEALSNGEERISARTVQRWEAGETAPPAFLRYALQWIEQEHGAPRQAGRPRKRRKEA